MANLKPGVFLFFWFISSNLFFISYRRPWSVQLTGGLFWFDRLSGYPSGLCLAKLTVYPAAEIMSSLTTRPMAWVPGGYCPKFRISQKMSQICPGIFMIGEDVLKFCKMANFFQNFRTFSPIIKIPAQIWDIFWEILNLGQYPQISNKERIYWLFLAMS